MFYIEICGRMVVMCYYNILLGLLLFDWLYAIVILPLLFQLHCIKSR